MIEIDILSLFPEYFKGPFEASIIKRALSKGIVSINHVDVREFGVGKHRRVDDRPYGGGPGMVMKPEPLKKAIESVKKEGSRVIYLSPQGELLNQKKCFELANFSHLILIAGHYEGIDERVFSLIDEEVSIGNYVLTNGALASIVLVDAVVRLVPGVLGNSDSCLNDSFSGDLLDHPHYTRPPEFEGVKVPEVLLSGDHKKIESWRREQALNKTKRMEKNHGKQCIN